MDNTATARRTAEDLLAEAREAIARLTPAEAWAAARSGAHVIDIRSEAARERDGIVPGSFHVPRTVLEWRLDPSSPWRNPHCSSPGRTVVVVCDHGYSSSLAAYALRGLGYEHASDIEGGFEAWLLAGLPVGRPSLPPAGILPGAGPADELEHGLEQRPGDGLTEP